MGDIDATRDISLAEAAGVPFCWMTRPSNDVTTACISETEYGLRVSTTNERATEESIKDYSDGGDAVRDFVERVQGLLRYEELRRKPLGH